MHQKESDRASLAKNDSNVPVITLEKTQSEEIPRKSSKDPATERISLGAK